MKGGFLVKKEKEKKKKKEKKQEEPITTKTASPKATPSQLEPPQSKEAEASGSLTDGEALELVVERIGGKWKIRILWALGDGQGKRYSSIKAAMPSITDMMLSQSLRDLCRDGLVQRNQYQEIPPRVEYQITAEGKGTLPGIGKIIEWAKKIS